MNSKDEVRFGTLHEDGNVTDERIIHRDSLLACPYVIMMPSHYDAAGKCRCEDPTHTEMVEWGYAWRESESRWVATAESWETTEVRLWIDNDESLYRAVRWLVEHGGLSARALRDVVREYQADPEVDESRVDWHDLAADYTEQFSPERANVDDGEHTYPE